MVNARYGFLVDKVGVGFIMGGVVIVCEEGVSNVFNVRDFIGVIEVKVIMVHIVVRHYDYFFIFIMCFLPFVND